MKSLTCYLMILAAIMILPPLAGCQPAPPDHQQVLVVTTPDWNTAPGEMRLYQWSSGQWQQHGAVIPVIVGRNGMAWGVGTEDFTSRPGPVKHEGDKRSPAGVFELGEAFGYAPPQDAAWCKLPYVHVTAATMCIEDTTSRVYNRILDEGSTPPDWTSTDHMLRKDDLYEWGVFVAHNYPDSRSAAGSCIFLHVWNPTGNGTAGCTSMDKQQMKDLIAWLDPVHKPLLVQMPADQYPAFRSQLGLPPF
ncbi:MAG: L,D-transpeptidase family protein [Bacteroidia bacterium]|nr:L,D-transpeptidase family protein [Bacteroidia bacterium]